MGTACESRFRQSTSCRQLLQRPVSYQQVKPPSRNYCQIPYLWLTGPCSAERRRLGADLQIIHLEKLTSGRHLPWLACCWAFGAPPSVPPTSSGGGRRRYQSLLQKPKKGKREPACLAAPLPPPPQKKRDLAVSPDREFGTARGRTDRRIVGGQGQKNSTPSGYAMSNNMKRWRCWV